MKDLQTHFVTTISPAHMGNQEMMHQDIHHHLAFPDGSLVGRPFHQDNHRPITGQTTLNDFELQIKPGIH